jgi:tRNA modification GTPase
VNETVVSLLTPPGKSALATIALAGPRAWATVRESFRPIRGVALAERPENGRFCLGRLGDAMSEEAVLAVRSSDPVFLEIHIHGGYEVTHYLLELFAARGVVPISWQALLQHTEVDPLRASAANVLALSTTTRTAGIALDQYQGSFTAFLRQVESLINTGQPERARQRIRDVLRYADVGRHLSRRWRVVIAGAPNVGKSSLVNALAGYERSIVSPIPGTTRDVVTARLAIDGWPVEVVDTAGLRVGGESLEQMGIDQARAALADADLVVWLLDASTEPVWPQGVLQALPQLHNLVNKVDLPAGWDLAGAGDALRISATTRQGIPDLIGTLGTWLVNDPPPAGAAVPLTNDLIERLLEADRLLENRPGVSGETALAVLCG